MKSKEARCERCRGGEDKACQRRVSLIIRGGPALTCSVMRHTLTKKGRGAGACGMTPARLPNAVKGGAEPATAVDRRL